MVTKSKIAQYWFDKGIDSQTLKVVLLTKETDFSRVKIVVVDWGEPECWACGRYAANLEQMDSKNIGDIWNNSQLQRCHIVARQFNGSDDVSNLFLLCPKCHRESPDLRDPTNFFAWVINKREEHGFFGECVCGITKAAKAKHIDMDELCEITKK